MTSLLSRTSAALLLSAVLLGAYARGGIAWPVGFIALVPWLLVLDITRTAGTTLLSAWAMSVAFTAAAFGWFGVAIGGYTGIGTPAGLAVLLLGAPLFQPQVIAFAVVRHAVRRRHGSGLAACAAAAAWVATEALVPKVLGDTLGLGLHPSVWMRQAADLGGPAGLTVALLLANAAVAVAIARRGAGWRAVAWPVGAAACVPLLLAGYGALVLHDLGDELPSNAPLRVGLVQSNIADYEALRAEKGADAVVRDVLDTHYAMSHDAVERQHVDAVLWSETVYPTTFGHPKSEAGATLDGEILEVVESARVPFVFGTYDRDDAGEYNAAAFVAPGQGLVGRYRKTRLFPLTEHVPAWLDGPVLRQWLPWAGTWRPGDGARVFPLRLADGREVPVLPLICLDDVDTQLAVDGARLGAQAILTMSNDAWFAQDPIGARLHQAAAAFRSIETRLPQFRVTTTGHSGAIDATGTVHGATRVGERSLVIADLPVGTPPRTLVVRWGDWVGRAAAVFLVLLAAASVWRRRQPRDGDGTRDARPALPADVVVLPPMARVVTAALRAIARAGLLAMALAFVAGVLPTNTFALIRLFLALFLVPEGLVWLVLRAYAAQATLAPGALVLTRGARRVELPLVAESALDVWRLPAPAPGLWLRGGRTVGLVHRDPLALAQALAAEGVPGPSPTVGRYAQVRAAIHRGRLDHPAVKFVLFPLLLAIPAFRLHQHIAYGSSFGEAEAFGVGAYLAAFALWWAAWAIAAVLCAATARAAIEAGTLVGVALHRGPAVAMRRTLERLGLVALYLGLPAWLAMRVYGG